MGPSPWNASLFPGRLIHPSRPSSLTSSVKSQGSPRPPSSPLIHWKGSQNSAQLLYSWFHVTAKGYTLKSTKGRGWWGRIQETPGSSFWLSSSRGHSLPATCVTTRLESCQPGKPTRAWVSRVLFRGSVTLTWNSLVSSPSRDHTDRARPKAQVHTLFQGRCSECTEVISQEPEQSGQVHQQPLTTQKPPLLPPLPVPTSGHLCSTSCPLLALITQTVICASPSTPGWMETFPCLLTPPQKVLQISKPPFFRIILRQGLPLAYLPLKLSQPGMWGTFIHQMVAVHFPGNSPC